MPRGIRLGHDLAHGRVMADGCAGSWLKFSVM